MTSISSFELIDAPLVSTAATPGPPESVSQGLHAIVSPAFPSVLMERDSEFYMEDVMSIFVVENCLFKVYRFFLDREAVDFPKAKAGSNDQPIELHGVTCFEFKTLLNFLFNVKYDSVALMLPEWIALLSVSTKFDMPGVRRRAIAEITLLRSGLDAIDQIDMALKYHVQEWLNDAYITLCGREKSLTSQEAKRLGDDVPFLVAEAREAILRVQLVAAKETTPRGAEPQDVPSIVRRVVDEVFNRKEREKEKEMARRKMEKSRKEKEKLEKEKEQKLKEAREVKEKAEKAIMLMEQADKDEEKPKEKEKVAAKLKAMPRASPSRS